MESQHEGSIDDDTDDKDDTKRKSRNLSEKKRRDQFNMLINELNSIVSSTSRKMDKSTVLKSTIAFLRNQNEISVRSRVHEITEDWKPSFLTNEEFTHIVLEAVDGFIIVFSLTGLIMYTSASVTSLLGYLPSDLMNGEMSLLELVCEDDHQLIYDILSGRHNDNYGQEHQIDVTLRMKRGPPDVTAQPVYELVQLVGCFRDEAETPEADNAVSSTNQHGNEVDSGVVFVGTGRLLQCQPICEVRFACESNKCEFSSRHNLDWKFLALDARATPIIGYVQLDVVGTSGYDYYHVDDLDRIVSSHQALMEKGEGMSSYYRFLTKGQQWIWLQTRYYISYHQWNAKPEFVVCSHRVIDYVDVMLEARKSNRDVDDSQDDLSDVPTYDARSSSRYHRHTPIPELSSDSASLSEDSYLIRPSRGARTPMVSHNRKGLRVTGNMRQSPAQPAPTPTLTPAPGPGPSDNSPQHYVAAEPLQPLLSSYTLSPVHSQYLRPAGSMPDEVKKKQQELLQLRQLMCQKEEELQQYVISQSRSYNVVPSILSVPVPYNIPGMSHGPSLITLVPPAALAVPAPITRSSSSDTADTTHQGSVNLMEGEGNFTYQTADVAFTSPSHHPHPPR